MAKAMGAEPAPYKEKRSNLFTPIRKKIISRSKLIFDFETKDADSDEPGFTNPFQIGFLDEEDNYRSFWNDNAADPNLVRRALSKGGCVDTFLRTLFGYPHTATPKSGWRPNKKWTSRFAELWAHNGGRFDITLLLVWLRKHRDAFSFDATCIQGRMQRVVVKARGPKGMLHHGCEWTFLDSAMLLKMRLSEATELFSGDSGTKKLSEFDLATPRSDRAMWELYNAADCRGLRDALLGFQEMIEAEGGSLGTTAPSTAMNLFRRKFLHEDLPRAKCFPGCDGLCHGCERKSECDKKCHGCLHAWIRRGLVGGRSEIFERFAPAPIYYYDRNSSYPASAREDVPVGLPYVQSGAEFEETHKAMRASGKIGFVECMVFVPPGCPLPPLPKVSDGKLKFLTGSFSGIWEYDELMLLFDPLVNGRILHVTKAVWFEGKPIFKEFMESLYEYRKKKPKEKDKTKWTMEDRNAHALSEFAKLMMNSLIGKTATKEEREEIILKGPRDKWTEFEDARPIDGNHETCQVWCRPKFIDASYIVPHLNARILALGRIALWRAGKSVIMAGGRLYSSDTDAWIGSVPMPDELLHDSDLGQWKREYAKDMYAGEFVQPKCYALDSVLGGPSIVHMKGIPRQHQSMQIFMRFRNGQELYWKEDRVSQPKHVLRSLESGDPYQGIVMLDSIKRLRSQYDKRVVHDDGTTSAIVVDEREYEEALS